jgi:hypothetical protein
MQNIKLTPQTILLGIFIIIVITLLYLYFFNRKYWDAVMFFKDEGMRYTNYLVSITWKKDDKDIPIPIGKHKQKAEEIPDNVKEEKEAAYFVANAVIDFDNSGKEAIFIGGNKGEHDSLLIYNPKTKKLEDKIEGTGLDDLMATHAAVSIDLDKDGWVDLIVARQNGVFLYKNKKNGTFSKSLLLEKQAGATPLAITVSDYNKDGYPDIYVSQFIDKPESKFFQFHNDAHSKRNVFLEGQKDGTFKDITKKSGIDNRNNTFTSIFTDINKDSYPDLININDTGKLGFYENHLGERFYKRDPFPKYGSYMGVSLNDIDNDGDLDYYFSNVGNSLKVTKLSRGNLKANEVLTHDHILLRNDGNFKFVDIAKDKGVNNAGFSWGPLFTDLDLDSHMDLLVSQNFDQIPTQVSAPLPSQRWIYDDDLKKFIKYKGLANPSVGQAPLSIDIDNDGLKDIIWVNMIGPSRAFKIINKNNNNFISVKLPDTLDFANAKITVKTPNNEYIREHIIGGTGFSSDASTVLQFGLGKEDKVETVTIKLINGHKEVIENPKINTTIMPAKPITKPNDKDSSKNHKKAYYDKMFSHFSKVKYRPKVYRPFLY